MNEMSYKTGIRLGAIAVLLVVFNIIYEHTFWKSDVKAHADMLQALNDVQDSTDILFLSSSSNYFYPKSDTNKLFISEWLQLFYPKQRVNAIYKGYLHAGMFRSILENIHENSPIKTVVLELNLRSFGAYWLYSNVETSYSAQQLLMDTKKPLLLRRFLLSLDYYDNKTNHQRELQYLSAWENDTLNFPKHFPFHNVKVWDWHLATHGDFKNSDGQVDMLKRGFTCNIVKSFAFQIDVNKHPRIADLDAIVQWAKKRNIHLVFAIMPEDLERASSMVGDEINWFLEKNKALIVQRYGPQGVIIVDGLNLLNSQNFYETYPTEHYISPGRALVAQKIAEAIDSIYPGQRQKRKFFTLPTHRPILNQFSHTIAVLKTDKQLSDSIEQQARIQNVNPDLLWLDRALIELNKESAVEKSMKVILGIDSWRKSIEEKAQRNQRSFDDQLYLDAVWSVDNAKKPKN